jgi:hypothetical protein
MIEDIRTRIAAVHSGDQPPSLDELEELYTTGCAHVLELEAEALRSGGRPGAASLAAEQLRAELRHVRTAIEWLRDDAEAAGTG